MEAFLSSIRWAHFRPKLTSKCALFPLRQENGQSRRNLVLHWFSCRLKIFDEGGLRNSKYNFAQRLWWRYNWKIMEPHMTETLGSKRAKPTQAILQFWKRKKCNFKVFAQNFRNMVLKTFFLIFEDWSYIGIITFRKFENNTADFKLLKPLIFMLSVLNKKAKLTLARRHCCPCRFKQMDHFSNVLFYNFKKGALNPNFSILTLNMKKK